MWLIHIFVVITLRTHSDDYIKLKIPIPLRAFCEMNGYEMLKRTVHTFSLRLQALSKQMGTDLSAFHIWCQCPPHSFTVAFLTFGFILQLVSVSPSWLWNVRGLSLCFTDLPSSLLRFLVCLGHVDVGPNKNVNKSCVLTLSRKNQGCVLHAVRKVGLTDGKREGMGEAEWQQVFPEVEDLWGAFLDPGPSRDTAPSLAPLIPGEHTASASSPLSENVREQRGLGRVPTSRRTVVGDSVGYNPGHTIQEEAPTPAPFVSGPSLDSMKPTGKTCSFLWPETQCL